MNAHVMRPKFVWTVWVRPTGQADEFEIECGMGKPWMNQREFSDPVMDALAHWIRVNSGFPKCIDDTDVITVEKPLIP